MISVSTFADIIAEQKEVANLVVSNVSEKFALYMAYATMCCNQLNEIKNVNRGIKDLCVNSKGKFTRTILILDFKMKYEAKSNCASTVGHVGKCKIGWYRCALMYNFYEYKKNDEGALLYDDDGKVIMSPHKPIISIDQVLEDGN